MMDWLLSLFGNRTFGASRSPRWSEVRKTHIALHPLCAVCGKKGTFIKANEVHHVESFASKPELELLGSNLRTLCRLHHQWIGHLGSFQSINESLDKDIAIWSEKIKNRPKWNGQKWVYPSCNKSYNESVKDDAYLLNKKIVNRP